MTVAFKLLGRTGEGKKGWFSGVLLAEASMA